jgi:hypothetical protein
MSEVLKRIIASKRLPVLFIGSGISKRYLKDFPSWDQLLDRIREEIGITKTAFEAKRQEIKNSDYSLSNGKINQMLATYLQSRLLEKIENDEIDLHRIFTEEELKRCTDEGVDYFKMLVAKHVSAYEVKDECREELNKFKKISEKISMIFTTNYDEFLRQEVFCDFKEYESQNKYYFRTQNGYGEIYKIHGSVTDPNGIIICERDYERFDNTLKLVSSKLINALLDFPVIFIGYSLEDENIKKILTDFVNSFDDEILKEIKKYMVMVVHEHGQNGLVEGEKQFSDQSSGKSITLTTIKTDNFALLYDYFDMLTPSATVYELRKYKVMVADIIARAAKGEKTIYVQEIDEANADGVALYIGSKNSIESIEKSVNIFTNEEIFQAALNGKKIDYNAIATYWYESKSIQANVYTPIFLIKNCMSIPFESGSEKFRNNYQSRKIYFTREIKFKGDKISNYEGLKKYKEKILLNGTTFNNQINKITDTAMRALFSRKITVEQYEIFLKELLKECPEVVHVSNFKKAACFLWFVKFEQ